jgi:hypothetical protein
MFALHRGKVDPVLVEHYRMIAYSRQQPERCLQRPSYSPSPAPRWLHTFTSLAGLGSTR